MTNDLRWMLSSDQQIPFQDDRALKLWFSVMRWFKPDVVDLLGDTSDQWCFSRFEEGTTSEFLNKVPDATKAEDIMKFLVAEEDLTAKFYEENRRLSPKAEIFSALGNHDIRVFRYADRKLQDMLSEVTPEKLWGFDKLGIDYIYYEDVPKHRYGDIFVHHGVSALAESGASIKSDISNLGVSLIRGHSHRMASYYRSYPLRNETLRGYEIGHMCKVDATAFKYDQIHNWQQGFAVAHIHGKQIHIQLIEIRPDYSCVVDGKRFKA